MAALRASSEPPLLPDGGHHIWGEVEVLSCYSSSETHSHSPNNPKNIPANPRARKLPKPVQQHLANMVSFFADSSGSVPRTASSDSVRRLRGVGGVTPTGTSPLPMPMSGAATAVARAVDGEGGDVEWAALQAHLSDECRPCLYLNSKVGCHNGNDCRFCHLPHPKKNRPCKAMRMHCKELVSMLDTAAPDPTQLLEVTKQLCPRSSYMRTILRCKQRQIERELAPRGSAGQPVPPSEEREALAAGITDGDTAPTPVEGRVRLMTVLSL